MENQTNILWQKCLDVLADNLTATAYNTWFLPIIPLQYKDNVLTLQVKSQFVASYIEENYIHILSKVLYKVFGPQTRLEYNVLIDSTSGAGTTVASKSDAADGMAEVANPVIQRRASNFETQLNETSTFQTFVPGEPNKLARTAGLTISRQPGYNAFNPFFIYGGSGVGKTHLANAIGNQVLRNDPSKKVLYVAANTFKMQFQDAASHNKIPDFLNFYQQVDVLIVDDIQFFSGLKGTQDTFFHIFNYLQQSHKQLILTSDRSPLQLKDIEDRLLTRFKWGLSAEIARPDYALRKAILLSHMRTEGVELNEEIVDYIATNVTDSVRNLEGVLASLFAYSTLLNREIDMQLAEEVVSRVVQIRPRAIDIPEIVGAVCEHFNVNEKALRSQTRLREVAEARHVASYLCKELTDHSLGEIAGYLGNRSHATILHSYRFVKTQIENDPVLRHQINQIKEAIRL